MFHARKKVEPKLFVAVHHLQTETPHAEKVVEPCERIENIMVEELVAVELELPEPEPADLPPEPEPEEQPADLPPEPEPEELPADLPPEP